MLTEVCDSVRRRELQAHRRHRDEGTGDEQHYVERGRLQDHLLVAKSIYMHVDVERDAADVEIELRWQPDAIGCGQDNVPRQAW